MSALVAEDNTPILKWVKSFNKVPSGVSTKARMLCMHWAGGNGMAFRHWAALYGRMGIDILSMHAAGRLHRSKEPLLDNVAAIVGKISACLLLL